MKRFCPAVSKLPVPESLGSSATLIDRGKGKGSQYSVYNSSVASNAYGSGFYPYTSSPPNLSKSQRNSHAYDIGYRVGQDDFHHKKDKHYVKHPGLYDSDTRESFKKGYEKGYDDARRSGR